MRLFDARPLVAIGAIGVLNLPFIVVWLTTRTAIGFVVPPRHERRPKTPGMALAALLLTTIPLADGPLLGPVLSGETRTSMGELGGPSSRDYEEAIAREVVPYEVKG